MIAGTPRLPASSSDVSDENGYESRYTSAADCSCLTSGIIPSARSRPPVRSEARSHSPSGDGPAACRIALGWRSSTGTTSSRKLGELTGRYLVPSAAVTSSTLPGSMPSARLASSRLVVRPAGRSGRATTADRAGSSPRRAAASRRPLSRMCMTTLEMFVPSQNTWSQWST